jgi:tRNA(Met) cytidine acetyltransferase
VIDALLSPWQEAGGQGLRIGTPPVQASDFVSHRTASQLKQSLGQETDFAVLDLQNGIEAEALAIVSGMIRAGGVCLLGLPAPDSNEPNRAMRPFISDGQGPESDGFVQWLQTPSTYALTLTQSPGQNRLPDWLSGSNRSNDTRQGSTEIATARHPAECTEQSFTPEQAKVYQTIETVATGHRKRPLIIEAPRGRGKSTLLGLACWQLWQRGKTRLVMTAARPAQIHQAWSFLQRQPGCEETGPHTLSWHHPQTGQTHQVHYQPPDALLADTDASPPDLLLIDEAAHLSQPLLWRLFQRYPRVVAATTTEGYEGSGHGFVLKLLPRLRQTFDRVYHQRLQTPVRWAPGDPLEQAINDLLCLGDADRPEDRSKNRPDQPQNRPAEIEPNYQAWSIPALLKAPDHLRQIMALLGQAHYQHRPNDLMRLLSLPQQALWTQEIDQTVVGVLWALPEGLLPPHQPGRRFQGHLVAQKLAQINWDDQWQTADSWRIQRLAVAPDWQNRGLGSALLQRFVQSASAQNKAYLSTSFGATPELLRFWKRHGFAPRHLGLKQDHASGRHSVMMVRPVCENVIPSHQNAQTRFYRELSWQLAGPLNDLDPALLPALWIGNTQAGHENASVMASYLQGRPFESCALALRDWTLTQLSLSTLTELSPMAQAWLKKVVQHQTWSKVVSASPCNSRKSLEQQWKNWLTEQF